MRFKEHYMHALAQTIATCSCFQSKADGPSRGAAPHLVQGSQRRVAGRPRVLIGIAHERSHDGIPQVRLASVIERQEQHVAQLRGQAGQVRRLRRHRRQRHVNGRSFAVWTALLAAVWSLNHQPATAGIALEACMSALPQSGLTHAGCIDQLAETVQPPVQLTFKQRRSHSLGDYVICAAPVGARRAAGSAAQARRGAA
jgi:hypothetical protein